MYIYTFTSRLFVGQYKRVITNYPVRNYELLIALVNEGNDYSPENRWILDLIQA